MKRELYHYGILGQKWGVRRYQNDDGSLTPAGKARYTHYQSTGPILKRAKNNLGYAAYSAKKAHALNKERRQEDKDSKEKKGLTDTQKKVLKGVAIAGAAAGTAALAAYGAKKYSDMTKADAVAKIEVANNYIKSLHKQNTEKYAGDYADLMGRSRREGIDPVVKNNLLKVADMAREAYIDSRGREASIDRNTTFLKNQAKGSFKEAYKIAKGKNPAYAFVDVLGLPASEMPVLNALVKNASEIKKNQHEYGI